MKQNNSLPTIDEKEAVGKNEKLEIFQKRPIDFKVTMPQLTIGQIMMLELVLFRLQKTVLMFRNITKIHLLYSQQMKSLSNLILWNLWTRNKPLKPLQKLLITCFTTRTTIYY